MCPSTIHNSRAIYKIASMPGDGIGPEVIDAGIQVLNKLSAVRGDFEFDFKPFAWGSDAYKRTGQYIPDGGLKLLRKYDAIFFGAVGHPGKCLVDKLPPLHPMLTSCRRPRSCVSLGTSIGYLPVLPAVR